VSVNELTVYLTDSGLTHLLHDLSPGGGTYPTLLFCKLLAVTRETKVTLSNCTKPKSYYCHASLEWG